MDVTFTMYDGDGNIAGTPWRGRFGPFEPYQIDIFKATGNGSVVTTTHDLLVTATAPVFGYVTVVDSLSGDQIFVNAADDE